MIAKSPPLVRMGYALILALAWAFPAAGAESKVEAVAEVASVAPGRPFWVAVEITPRAGAVLPWFDPETGSLSIAIEVTGRAGFAAGETILPAPERDPDSGIYRYQGAFWLLQEVRVPADLPRGETYVVRGSARWLGCLETCGERFGDFALALPAGRGEANPETAGLFSQLRAAAPPLFPWPVRLEARDGTARLNVYLDPAGIDLLSFLPEAGGNKRAFEAFREFEKAEGGFAANFPERDFSGLAEIRGLLFVESKDGTAVFRLAVANLPEAPTIGAGYNTPRISLAMALAFAFVGGLILNLMPCVFPILSLKVFGLVKAAQRSRQSFALDGIAYTAGVVLSFLIVALALLTLRAGGEAVGWGFQLQSPVFVVGLALVMFVVALNFAGLYSIRLPLAVGGGPKGEGLNEAFLTGALATLLATPCTAPFMAPALGLALTLHTIDALLVFAVLGFGLAFPYLLVSVVPGAQGLFPKPGPWMAMFRKVLALPLVATIGWLLWVLNQQAGTAGVVAALAYMGIVLGLFLAWRGAKKLKAGARTWVLALAAILALSAGHFLYPQLTLLRAAAPEEAESFSMDKVRNLRLEGKGVLVNFTARWCLTCLLNERLVLAKPEFRDFLAANNIVYLEADWTNPNEEIARALEGLGRSALPVYAFYPPGGPTRGVILLPEVLTLEGTMERITAEIKRQ